MKVEHEGDGKPVRVTFTIPAQKWAYLEKVAETFNCTVGDMFSLFVNKVAATAGMVPQKTPSMVTNASRYSAVVTHLHKMEVAALKVAAWDAGSPSVPEYVLSLIRQRIDPIIESVPPMKGASAAKDAEVLTDDGETFQKVKPLMDAGPNAVRDGISKMNLDKTPPPTTTAPTAKPRLTLVKN